MNSQTNLREAIGEALVKLQMIEEALRQYFDLRGVTYQKKATLGQLVNKFKELNLGTELSKNLTALNQSRIDVAHKIWLRFYNDMQDIMQVNDKNIAKALTDCVSHYIKDMENIENNARNCWIKLIYEIRRLRI